MMVKLMPNYGGGRIGKVQTKTSVCGSDKV